MTAKSCNYLSNDFLMKKQENKVFMAKYILYR